ncbi:SMP-30/gluconolactonase/LRE family protein [Mesorhizobium sp. M0142]|uniref:SMP-30/gluconolactonase/LRE family protein n=1 Tax=unclassified Mesorhizobium TaxID=325217 RepID=UPI00333C09A7
MYRFAVIMMGFCDPQVAAAEELFVSQQLTRLGEYSSGIEGPAVDKAGNLYVVNFKRKGTVGRIASGASHSELFLELPSGSRGNGIRFDTAGRMFVADFRKHNIFVVESGERVPHVYVHDERFNQPNDLAVAADGTLFASDPSFRKGSGQVWRIDRRMDGRGQATLMHTTRRLGTTNGIDLSPDGKLLYVGESSSHELWVYQIRGNELASPQRLKVLAGEPDGLRTDVDGNIYVVTSEGKVSVLTPNGTHVRDVPLIGREPTNLTFGGPDGRTVYVTQRDGRYIETFRTNSPGREF